LTNEELVALIQSGIDVNVNMTELYEQNKWLMHKLAYPYKDSVEIEDLMQEAYFGLVKAVESFDPGQELKFMTYAVHKIKAQMSRYNADCGRTKRIPVHMLQEMSKYHSFKKKFIQDSHIDPTDDDFMSGLGITKRKLKSLEKCIYECNTMSLEAIILGTDDMSVADTIADDFNLEESIIEADSIEYASNRLWAAVDSLEEKRKKAIVGLYKDNMTLGDIAQEQGVSTERIRQLETDGIRKLQKMDELKEAAEMYGYDCSQAYHYGVGRFKDTGMSSTEFVALKRIETSAKKISINKSYDHLIEQILNY